METQEITKVETVPDRQLQREEQIDNHFKAIDDALANQPTKEEFDELVIEMRAFMTQVNGYVKTFTVGVDILTKSSRLIFYAVITVGSVGAGIIAIKGGFVAVLGWFGVVVTHSK